MIEAQIEIQIEDNKNDNFTRCRIIKKDIPEVTEKTCSELLAFANQNLQEGEEVYQLCAKRPHAHDTLPQPFWDFFNGNRLINWWNRK